jgi:hypothetical protein
MIAHAWTIRPFLELLVHFSAEASPTRCWTSANLGKTLLLLRTAFLRLLVRFDATLRRWCTPTVVSGINSEDLGTLQR